MARFHPTWARVVAAKLVCCGLISILGTALVWAGPDPIEAASSNVIKGPAFQLTYRATRSVILPKADWPKLIEADRKDLISQGIEAKAADRMVADTLRELARPPLTYEVTFAHGLRQFYYAEELVGESLTEARKARRVVYYDGVQTFHLLGNTLNIIPGLDLRGVNFQPLFGAGFADLKLAQPGQPTEDMERLGWQKEKFAMVFMSSFERNGFGSQVPGYVETTAVNGKTVFQGITVGHTTDFLSKLRFSNYKAEPVGFLAHQVEIRQFLTKSRLPAANPTPRELVKLELLSARAGDPRFRSPLIRNLLRAGDPIFVGEGSKRQSIIYQPNDAEITGLFRDRIGQVVPELAREVPFSAHITGKPASSLLATAQRNAKRGKKAVFVVFGATWCQPCHELEKRLAEAPLKDLMSSSYEMVHLKIMPRKQHADEVNAGAEEMYRTWSGGENPGVPFYVVLDATGKVLATSQATMDDGTMVNLPGVTGEAGDHLLRVLRKTARNTPKPALDTFERWLQKN